MSPGVIAEALRRLADEHGRKAVGSSYEHHARAQTTLRDAADMIESLALGCEIAYEREPTQAEGDAHERSEPTHAHGECFVAMGGWTGRRCRVCHRWVWGGPTACRTCAEVWPRRAAEQDLRDSIALDQETNEGEQR